MNFLNGEKGTGEDGERFVVMLGGESWAQSYVQEQFRTRLRGIADRIHFLDPRLTQATLRLSGGINCRIKPEGE
jgi:hypothetical protein